MAAGRENQADVVRQLRAALRRASRDHERLAYYLSFLRNPGRVPFGVQLEIATEALSTIGATCLHKRPVDAAELHARRARLFVRADEGSHTNALADLGHARAYCDVERSVAAVRHLIAVAALYHDFAQPEIAIEIFDGAARMADALRVGLPGARRNDERRKELLIVASEAREAEGDCQLFIHAIQNALRAHLAALELREQTNRTDLEAASLAAVARVYAELHEPRTALDYADRSLEAAKSCYDKRWMAASVARAYETLASLNTTLRRAEQAREHLMRARLVYQHGNDPVGVARTHVIAGRINEMDDLFADASDEYATAYRILDEYRARIPLPDDGFAERRLLPYVLFAASRLDHRLGRQRARFGLINALRDAEAIRDRRLQRDVHLELTELYRESNRCCTALEHYRAASVIAYELGSEEHRRAIAELQKTFDTGRWDRREKRLRAVEADAGYRQQELQARELQAEQRENILRGVRTQINDALRAYGAVANIPLEQILESIRAGIERALSPDDSRLQHRRKRRLDANEEFIECLRRRHPDLTDDQCEICALIRRRLKAQEIADVRDIARATVYKHRENITNKLGLTSSQDLEDYLQTVCT